MKLMGILAVLAFIALLAWFWSIGGEQPVTTVTDPVVPVQQAG